MGMAHVCAGRRPLGVADEGVSVSAGRDGPLRRCRGCSSNSSRDSRFHLPLHAGPALDAARSDRGGCSSANNPPHTPHFRTLYFVAAAANNNRVRSLRAKGFRVPAEKMMMGGRPGRVAAQSTNTRYTVHPA